MHGTWNVLTSTPRFQSFWIVFIWYYSSLCVCLGLWMFGWMWECRMETFFSWNVLRKRKWRLKTILYYIVIFFIKILLAPHHLIFGPGIGDSDFTNFTNFTTIVLFCDDSIYTYFISFWSRMMIFCFATHENLFQFNLYFFFLYNNETNIESNLCLGIVISNDFEWKLLNNDLKFNSI